MTDSPESTLSYVESPAGGIRLVEAPYLVLAMEAMRPQAASARWFLNDVDQIVIGRAKRRGHRRYTDNGVSCLRIDVPDGWMSSTHATLTCEGSTWILRDSDSKNGSFVGDDRVSEHVLQDGDQFAAGNTVFLFYARGQRAISDAVDVEVAGAAAQLPALTTLSPEVARDFDGLQRVAAQLYR